MPNFNRGLIQLSKERSETYCGIWVMLFCKRRVPRIDEKVAHGAEIHRISLYNAVILGGLNDLNRECNIGGRLCAIVTRRKRCDGNR